GSFRTAHGADFAARATAIEEVCSIGLEPADARAARHFQPREHRARLRVDPPDVAVVTFPGSVPQLAVDPAHAGDEAFRLDRSLDRAGLGIDLMNLSVAVLAHPQAAFGPGESRVLSLARRGNRLHDFATLGIDLVDPCFGDLVEVGPVECRSRIADALE